MRKNSDRSSSGRNEAGAEGTKVTPSLLRTFGPMAAGLAIDGLDLMTYGPIGLYTGLIVGGTAGYLLAPMLGFSERGRWLCALMTGVYCTVPLTGFIPAAAVAAGLTQAFPRERDPSPDELADDRDPALRPEGSIEAQYEVQDEVEGEVEDER